MNYYAILLFKRKSYAENDAFEMTFQIYDEINNLQETLSSFKFSCIITNNSRAVTKYDANYDDGSSSQISVSGDKVTVHISTDDTNDFDGDFVLEFQLEDKVSGFRQTVYRNQLSFYEEELED